MASSIDTFVCISRDSANKYIQCRMVATVEFLNAVQTKQLPAQAGLKYAKSEFVLWSSIQISSAYGNTSSAVGPLYCSGGRTVYLDMSFFSGMEHSLGAADVPLVEEYTVAHELGHRIQHLTGQMAKAGRSSSGTMSDSVRLESQADCYAGIWVSRASSISNPNIGKPFLNCPSSEKIKDALGAAGAVGDDHVQEWAKGHADSGTRTHRSSEQRVRWFTTGMNSGSMQAYNTFVVDASQP